MTYKLEGKTLKEWQKEQERIQLIIEELETWEDKRTNEEYDYAIGN